MKRVTSSSHRSGDKPGGNMAESDNTWNIKVVARCRPRSKLETDAKSPLVVECNRNGKDIIEVKHGFSSKTFHFDKVFSALDTQLKVYKGVAEELLHEVLKGYDSTIFSYGQTSTGKTYTMEGKSNMNFKHWENDPDAGIIPRTLHHLFEILEKGNTEYAIRVTFVELYNEEIRDLLTSDDNAKPPIIRNNEKGVCVLEGAEEVVLNTKNDVYKILSLGSKRKRVASTKINEYSSRSHSVFTIFIHKKQSSELGWETISLGKLNLVDLAGSENIGRSGATNIRAVEAGLINKSLLTLGRVITCLVEGSTHIPYRESKLTRILQDSLGGKAKTVIIATISPAQSSVEETLSTLEYASRAKSIKNSPQQNLSEARGAFLKEYSGEIEKLKRDLYNQREKNGVFIDLARYNEMNTQVEHLNSVVHELTDETSALKEQLAEGHKHIAEYESELAIQAHQNENMNALLDESKTQMVHLQAQLELKIIENEDFKYLIRRYQEKEKDNITEYQHSTNQISLMQNDIVRLGHVIAKHKETEERNAKKLTYLGQTLDPKFQSIHSKAELFLKEQESLSIELSATLNSLEQGQFNEVSRISNFLDGIKTLQTQLVEDNNNQAKIISEKLLTNDQYMGDSLDSCRESIERNLQKSTLDQDSKQMLTLINELDSGIKTWLEGLHKKIKDSDILIKRHLDYQKDFVQNFSYIFHQQIKNEQQSLVQFKEQIVSSSHDIHKRNEIMHEKLLQTVKALIDTSSIESSNVLAKNTADISEIISKMEIQKKDFSNVVLDTLSQTTIEVNEFAPKIAENNNAILDSNAKSTTMIINSLNQLEPTLRGLNNNAKQSNSAINEQVIQTTNNMKRKAIDFQNTFLQTLSTQSSSLMHISDQIMDHTGSISEFTQSLDMLKTSHAQESQRTLSNFVEKTNTIKNEHHAIVTAIKNALTQFTTNEYIMTSYDVDEFSSAMRDYAKVIKMLGQLDPALELEKYKRKKAKSDSLNMSTCRALSQSFVMSSFLDLSEAAAVVSGAIIDHGSATAVTSLPQFQPPADMHLPCENSIDDGILSDNASSNLYYSDGMSQEASSMGIEHMNLMDKENTSRSNRSNIPLTSNPLKTTGPPITPTRFPHKKIRRPND